ncbi:pyridoxal phosphate-dependent aminotransferase [Streptomyces huiliensis]|uniref:pyridoxal phosphate-dependent aminotransferase n=1 Tax=Streptomyces huiliensis TaxID=2876027 RepID=UPI001CC0ED22|nr:pyridoxal phosphate-dependent aminotransferase [Streptomyces huiliensis]MBZ4321314.1 pyridoxal phosphate-dependent aminotransferase [Streptomyces huiliensis]
MTSRQTGHRTPAEVIALLTRTTDAERRLSVEQRLFPDLLNLGTAENILLFPRLNERVFGRLRALTEQDLRYPVPIYGTERMREDIVELLNPRFGGDLTTDEVFGTSGVSAALECLAFALKRTEYLADGDRVLIPAPFWQGFRWCFEQRPGLECVPAPLGTDFDLTLDVLRRTYHEQRVKPRLLVLTNPNNPLGVNYDKELLEKIYTWALTQTDMHVISDEMYAHSQLLTARTSFVSAFSLDAYRDHPEARDRVHVVWGFAKDFGLSGFKAGVALTRNSRVQDVLNGTDGEPYSWFSPFDSLKHHVIGSLLETRDTGGSFAAELMEEYRTVLTRAFDSARTACDEAKNIPYVFREGQNSAQFLWLDLREHLRPDAPEIPYEQGPHFPGEGDAGRAGDGRLPVLFSEIGDAESELFQYIKDKARVQLLPGQTLSAPEQGYFRLCFTAFDEGTVREAIRRVSQALASRSG